MSSSLPIEVCLPDLLAALRKHGRAVLQAPPGAGKTTRVPLALLADESPGKIVMLEPRRLAARAAAERMAENLGEPVGQRVGYRIRGDQKISAATRIEVVTEGILTRMLQDDPELPGVGCVIFDEFHERSLNADLGLALTWEARLALREDLRILVMSATLDAAPVSALLDAAPIITSEGQSYPVETHWLDRAPRGTERFEDRAAELITHALAETDEGTLVFLPGQGEIERVAQRLRLPDDVRLHKLFGSAAPKTQRAALLPEPDSARKLVLATNIAETSLTLADIRVVVDAGRTRRARFDPGSGMSRLVTEPVSRAEADQRRGRAGRLGPGTCYRMWARAAEGALPAFAPPEIERVDLADLALNLAAWGAQPAELAFLTQPPEGAYMEAMALLADLGATDAEGRITAHGRRLARVPAHPRLTHMLECAGPGAAPLAAILSDGDPMRGAGSDLEKRTRALRNGTGDPRDQSALKRIGVDAVRFARLAGTARQDLSAGAMLALAYPDRVGLRRAGDAPRWLLSGGRGVTMDAADTLAGARLIVVAETDGKPKDAQVRLAATLSEAELREVAGNRIFWEKTCVWSRRERRVLARRKERLGAIVLDDRAWKDAPPEAMTAALMEGVRDLGLAALKPTKAFRLLQARARYAAGAGVRDVSDKSLLDGLEDWLLPFATGASTLDALAGKDLTGALRAYIGRDAEQVLDRLAPASFNTPLGRTIPIDYGGDTPTISVRLQEMFGVTSHPVVGPDHLPIRISLLSPAGRPLQLTTDLPGFWVTSYADVRKEMRGRYPKHPWPEYPSVADPTLRAKPRR